MTNNTIPNVARTMKKCAACRTEKPVSEMKTCMHNQMHNYVCDSKCMHDFYNPPKTKVAPSPAGVDAGLVAVEWAKDAEEWGPALNEAGWLFLSELNEDQQKSALIFNNTKGPLRAAIMKYAEIVTAHRAQGVL